MKRSLPDELLSQLCERVVTLTGLDFPSQRRSDLETGLHKAARRLGRDPEEWARSLLSTPPTKHQIQVLASELTVGETYFFREKRTFEVLAQRILPELIRSRRATERRLRIWSAGCCTGEELYSVAILLDRILPDFEEWQVNLLGTDINPRFLQKARDGVFGEWSFRDAPEWLKDNYFKALGTRRFELLPRIRERAVFEYLNLAADPFPSLAANTNAMDLILCRNVLMYFAPDRARSTVLSFHRSLLNGGWLIVSPAETSIALFSAFSTVRLDGWTLYQKGPRVWQAGDAQSDTTLRSAGPPANWPDLPRGKWESDGDRSTGFPPVLPETVPAVSAAAPPETPLPLCVTETASPLGGPETGAGLTPFEEARVLYEQGDYQGACLKLKDQAEESSCPAETLAFLARSSANLGQLEEARSWAEKAVEADKLNTEWHYVLAMILQELGLLKTAAESLNRCLYLDPGFVLAHFALGNLALRQQNWTDAGRHFSNALSLVSRYPDDKILPHSDGLAAGRLRDMIRAVRGG
ncbi:MAG: CheR family methyltransferase [Acidobacteriota bacterium]